MIERVFFSLLAVLPVEGAPAYRVARTDAAAAALLAEDDAGWRAAERIEWGPEPYRTAFRALWSGDGLFVRFEVSDPDPWHTLTRRDERLWEEEVVEIFLQPAGSDGAYAELEINPVNTVCDLWIVGSSGRSPSSPIVDGPLRGRVVGGTPSLSGRSWDHEGLETRVHSRRDGQGAVTGWTAAAFLPWGGLKKSPAGGRLTLPPRTGEVWRFNVFRIERPGGPRDPKRDVQLLAWSPTGQPNFHVPSAFREMTFATP